MSHPTEAIPGPVRTCLGCRGRAAKSELLRVVWSDSGLVLDAAQTAPGRGAYLHPTAGCLQAAVRRRVIGRALRTDRVSAAELDSLLTAVVAAPEEKGAFAAVPEEKAAFP